MHETTSEQTESPERALEALTEKFSYDLRGQLGEVLRLVRARKQYSLSGDGHGFEGDLEDVLKNLRTQFEDVLAEVIELGERAPSAQSELPLT